MVRTLRSPSSTPLYISPDPMSAAKDVLGRTADILVSMGYSPQALAAHFAKVCAQKKQPTRRVDPGLASYLTQVGQVLAYWYVNSAYVDQRGRPLPLPLRGSGRSLSELIQRAVPGENPQEVIKALTRMRTLRRRGALYAPIRRFMSFAETAAYAYAQSLCSIRGLLHTVQHNVSTPHPAQRLLERRAANLSIPVRALPGIHDYFKREVDALLKKMDTHLIECEVPAGSEPTTSVYLVTFVHEDPLVTGTQEASKRSRSRRRLPP